MRIDEIIQHRPRHVGRVEARGGGQRGAVGQQVDAEGGETHDGAPGEGQAEDELRVVSDALGERVGGDEEQARGGVEEAVEGEAQQHGEAGEELGAGEDEGGAGGHGAAGDGPEARPRHVRVEVAVPQVVDGAARAAHDERAGEEERRGAEDGERWRGGGAGERRGEERGEETGEEEVVGARGLVEPNEFGVGDPRAGEDGEEAGLWRLIRVEDWVLSLLLLLLLLLKRRGFSLWRGCWDRDCRLGGSM